MIALELPDPMLWALRWLLFLGPLGAFLFLLRWKAPSTRTLVDCHFAFLYGAGLIFVTHQVAIHVGWWRYGGDALMLMGVPADIRCIVTRAGSPILIRSSPSAFCSNRHGLVSPICRSGPGHASALAGTSH
jgi:hypothetical protein